MNRGEGPEERREVRWEDEFPLWREIRLRLVGGGAEGEGGWREEEEEEGEGGEEEEGAQGALGRSMIFFSKI